MSFIKTGFGLNRNRRSALISKPNSRESPVIQTSPGTIPLPTSVLRIRTLIFIPPSQSSSSQMNLYFQYSPMSLPSPNPPITVHGSEFNTA